MRLQTARSKHPVEIFRHLNCVRDRVAFRVGRGPTVRQERAPFRFYQTNDLIVVLLVNWASVVLGFSIGQIFHSPVVALSLERHNAVNITIRWIVQLFFNDGFNQSIFVIRLQK